MNKSAINEYIKKLPKLDLHCHLDGSFSPDFVKKATGSPLSYMELLPRLTAPSDCQSLTEYLTCFDLPIAAIQSAENITAGVLDVLSSAAAENVRYIELRFAPACSVNEKLTYKDIYEAAIKGCKEGLEKYNIYSNIIVCAMRHHSPETNLSVLSSAMDYLGKGICALDIAGDESRFPNRQFEELFTKARLLGMPFTIHSGECGSVENVELAIDYGARRIGHGIALSKNPKLMARCKKSGVGLELCPTSNFQTKAISARETYPLKSFLDYGLLATVNTDNRTVSHTCITRELNLAWEELNISYEDIYTLCKNSIEISFANDNIKHMLYKELEACH